MSANKGSVTIEIMGKEYTMGCSTTEEVQSLQQSARFLNEQMNLVKSRGGTYSFETVAILAGLNISNDLLQQKNSASSSDEDSRRDLQQIEEKIEKALQRARQLEI